MLRFKMAAKNKFRFAKQSRDHNWKKKHTLPMELFSEIWLKVGEHEYIYIFEIKCERSILFKGGLVFGAQIFASLFHPLAKTQL